MKEADSGNESIRFLEKLLEAEAIVKKIALPPPLSWQLVKPLSGQMVKAVQLFMICGPPSKDYQHQRPLLSNKIFCLYLFAVATGMQQIFSALCGVTDKKIQVCYKRLKLVASFSARV